MTKSFRCVWKARKWKAEILLWLLEIKSNYGIADQVVAYPFRLHLMTFLSYFHKFDFGYCASCYSGRKAHKFMNYLFTMSSTIFISLCMQRMPLKHFWKRKKLPNGYSNLVNFHNFTHSWPSIFLSFIVV